MTWLILGGWGQFGRCMSDYLSLSGVEFLQLGHNDLDITNAKKLNAVISEVQPHVIVNSAAWTDVDAAEDDFESANQINCHGARNIANAAKLSRSFLVHISTDYVFDGCKTDPYTTSDSANPTTAYGKSKLCGENEVQRILPSHSVIVRTAWLYSKYGKNFVKTICAKAIENAQIKVVNDQLGQPTYAVDLAMYVYSIVASPGSSGVFHGTNAGQATWFELAQTIYELMGRDRSLVSPVTSAEYPTRAVRPKQSCLSHDIEESVNLFEMPFWQVSLKNSFLEIREQVMKELQNEI